MFYNVGPKGMAMNNGQSTTVEPRFIRHSVKPLFKTALQFRIVSNVMTERSSFKKYHLEDKRHMVLSKLFLSIERKCFMKSLRTI